VGKRRGNSEGTVYFHAPSGRWTGQVTVGRHPVSGKPVRKTVYGDTQREVIQKLDEARKAPVEEPARQTVRAAIDFWLTGCKARVDPKTVRVYEDEIAPARDYLGRLPLAELTAMDVADLFRWMTERGDSPDKVRRAGARLRQCLSKCVKIGLISVNPASRVDLPRHRPRQVTPLTAEEARRVLGAARGARHEAFFHLALDTGARQAEILALTWGDVRLGEAAEVFFNKALQGHAGAIRVKTTKTPKGRRRVPITRATAAVLEAARPADAGPEALVFPARHGGHYWPVNFRTKHWGPVKVAAGVPKARLHDLRRTCATLLLLANVHPKVVSERLGHSKIEITLNTYSHLLPGMQTSAVAALEAALGEPMQ